MKAVWVILVFLCATSLSALDVEDDGVFGHPVTFDDASFVSTYQTVAYNGPWVADFTQTKRIHGVNRTFRSTGTMLLQPSRGIVWNMRKPYASVLVVGPSYIVQQLPGQKTSRMEFGDNQIFTQISRTIEMVLAGNLAALDDAFSLSFQKEGADWTLALVPKQAEVASFVDSFVLGGADGLKTVLMREKGGDSIRYDFSSMERRSLSDDELAYFSL
ncbi:MAG: outer membrane lipoprotein carrier protein LolA [Sphaerochaetaceae bacterium]|nr:outer membrane lipoprotein carrier protein LolA [Spirochaetales bacterium]MDY5499106.1 outer membrane lipoprotein carrier protein LolA [Sphaerochaetaceae bacterium]